jgi:signal peptidase I
MPSSRSRHHEDDDLDEEEEDEPDQDGEDEDDEPAPRRHGRTTSARRARRRPHRPPVRAWRSTDEDEEEEEEEGPPGGPEPVPWRKKPVFWRARDSLFFEPLVALAVIVVLLVALFAYTQNWPPVYVVESNSMQHGPSDHLGLINAGDLVLAQKVPFSSITTYMVGLSTGYSTYGESGDVVLYWPNGQGSTPIIHRAIVYLEWDSAGSYNASIPAGLACGTELNPVWSYSVTSAGTPTCQTTHLDGFLHLYHVGWNSLNITINLTPSVALTTLGDHSGFLTMGDNNSIPDQASPLSTLVEPGWVIGVARGMIPWFGAVKLLLDGNAGNVPSESWELMGLTIVAAIAVAFGIHYALRTEGIETPLRRREDEEAAAEVETEGEERPPHRWWPHFRRHDEENEEDEAHEVRRQRTRPPPTTGHGRRGRPIPHVRRNAKAKKRRDSDDEL